LANSGIVLLVTLVLLVLLATLAYTLTARLAAQRHRDQYIIDYSKARYACDSGVKYALATLEELSPQLISRPNEPDFSDIFTLDETKYQELLAQWAAQLQLTIAVPQESSGTTTDSPPQLLWRTARDVNDANDVNDVNDLKGDKGWAGDSNDSGKVKIRGPYGPEWPLVTEPVEFEVGSAAVKIEIEDEDAKYPLGWALLSETEVQREAQAGLETFCEWMGFDAKDIDSLKQELKMVSEVKPFKVNFQPVTVADGTPPPPPAPTPAPAPGTTASSRPTRLRRPTRTTVTRKTVTAADQLAKQGADFAELFHSSMVDTELLARPTIISESRKESVLKYAGLWGSAAVNINTAPRHVLEAAFTFGGDANRIADEIIRRRRIKPFTDMDDLKTSLFTYSDSIRKCEKYITTASRFFTIRVTATSGVAEASSIIAITKDGKTIKRIAVISD
jgi:hypothetical protein